jgi:hypothetical protein
LATTLPESLDRLLAEVTTKTLLAAGKERIESSAVSKITNAIGYKRRFGVEVHGQI